MADVLTGLGIACVGVGVGLWSIPAALCVVGGIVLVLGLGVAWFERPRKAEVPQ